MHFELSAKLRILVFKRVEAVRTGGNDFFEVQGPENLNIAPRHNVEQIFIAHSPSGVAGAALLFAEDGEIDAGPLQETDEGARDFLLAAIQRSRAADPIKIFGLLAVRKNFYI